MRNYLVILFVLLSATLFAQTAQKIGYVDSQIILTQLPEAIKAQSAKVNIVSGATNSSNAFINSLSSALSQAKV